jgi:hypothetical protein
MSLLFIKKSWKIRQSDEKMLENDEMIDEKELKKVGTR